MKNLTTTIEHGDCVRCNNKRVVWFNDPILRGVPWPCPTCCPKELRQQVAQFSGNLGPTGLHPDDNGDNHSPYDTDRHLEQTED